MMSTSSTTIERPAAEHRLSTLFAPRSIAFVGATERSPWAGFIANNLRDFAFAGKAYAINRSGSDVLGIPGYVSCAAIGEAIDVAFLMVPQSATVAAMEEAAQAGVRNVVVLASGYAEVGEEGLALQDQLLTRAKNLGVNLWGPNSLGFNNMSARAPVSAIPTILPVLDARIAIVSQSGATASELNEFAHSQNIGTSFVAATGNEGQLTLADVVDYLVDHEPTRAIAIFAESIRDRIMFEHAARRAKAKSKPIIILKIGRSELATQVAQAHTGSLAGNDRVFDAVCEALGVIRVFTPEDLIVTAGLLAATGPLPRPGLEFISISGGACTLAADGAEAAGVMLPPHPPKTCERLSQVMPPFGSTLNPLDVTGAVIRDPSLLDGILPAAAAAPDAGLVAINFTVPVVEGQAGVPTALTSIGKAVRKMDKPAVMVLTTAKSLTEVTRRAIAEHDLPHIVCGIDALLRATAKAAWWSQWLLQPDRPQVPQEHDGANVPNLDNERAVLDYLAGYGIPVVPARIVTSREEAQAAGIAGPLALKILSPDIAHKSEVGGVRLNVSSQDAGEAYDGIRQAVANACPGAHIQGVIISPMRSGGIEVLVGVTRDPTWGPMIMVGFGGVLVELLTDVVIAPLPITPEQAREMLGRLRGAKLLQGFRGAPPADLEALSQVVARIGEAARALGPRLQTLEVNPLLVRGSDIEALDGLVLWQDGKQ